MEENKFKFPTEMVELPSKGLLYPEDSPLTEGKIEMSPCCSKIFSADRTSVSLSDSNCFNAAVSFTFFCCMLDFCAKLQNTKEGIYLHGCMSKTIMKFSLFKSSHSD